MCSPASPPPNVDVALLYHLKMAGIDYGFVELYWVLVGRSRSEDPQPL